MIIVNAPLLWGFAAATAGVGYTLLRYSRDGDLKHRSVSSSFANPEATTDKEAWVRLAQLANAPATEVTWNTSLFVSIVSSLVFMGLLTHARGPYAEPLPSSTTGIVWALSVLTVFGMQDAVNRWKSAHRKHAMAAEQVAIIERLRWMRETIHASSILTKAHAAKATHSA